jgi:hypothetical protein
MWFCFSEIFPKGGAQKNFCFFWGKNFGLALFGA